MTFDYLAAAETATNLTLKMLFNTDRASRLVTLGARDKKSQPGLENILNQIVNETILKEMYNKNDYVRLSNVQKKYQK